MAELFEPADAIEQAMARTGLSDFGPDGFHAGLEKSLAAFARMALTPAVRAAVNAKIVQDLATRLRIEQWYKDHPEIADQPVEGPVFVVGMPRTGTTATVGMLALDERFRFLRGWEGAAPMPPPVAGQEDADPRLVAAREAAKNYSKPHVHIPDPDGPEEDLAMLSGLDMHAYHGAFPMPDDYIAWWLGEDFCSTYAYHERVLKLLQSRRPPYLWLLKSPPHMFRLDAIVRQYPDAKFIMTHRDPLKIIPSVASLHCIMYEERCLPGTIDKKQIGPQLLRFWQEGVRRALAARAAIGEHRFIDVRNEDVVRQPLTVFERIYAYLDMPLGSELKDRVVAYNSRNAPGTFGAHHYTLEEYGLTAADIHDVFGSYSERFALMETSK